MQSLIVMYITSVQYIVSSLHYCYKQDVWWTCRCLWHMHITTCINYQHDFDYVTKTIIATAHIISSYAASVVKHRDSTIDQNDQRDEKYKTIYYLIWIYHKCRNIDTKRIILFVKLHYKTRWWKVPHRYTKLTCVFIITLQKTAGFIFCRRQVNITHHISFTSLWPVYFIYTFICQMWLLCYCVHKQVC